MVDYALDQICYNMEGSMRVQVRITVEQISVY
jgi:hypothetical protein